MEIFFNRKEWEKEGMKKDYENQDSQDHSLETVKNRKTEDQLERQFIAQTWCEGKRINSRNSSSNAENQNCGGEGD